MSAYKYETITDEASKIRVLQLRPGRLSDEMICELQTCSLDDPAEILAYSALSYAWGTKGLTKTVKLAGSSVLVTESVHSALVHLRDKRRKLRIWIDALCINQADLGERMHQVSQMKTIFQKAAKVVIWLGESDDETAYAMQWLKSGTLDDLLGPHKTVWKLLQKPWWTRILVLQEVAAARDEPILRCGRDEVKWSALSRLESKVPFHDWSTFLLFMPVAHNEYADLTKCVAHTHMFLEVVKRLRTGHLLSWREVFALRLTMKATDQRDLAYAVLGIIENKSMLCISPDYTKDNNTVLCMATARNIACERGLEALTLTAPSMDNNLPSWVLSFSKRRIGIFQAPGVGLFAAAGTSSPRVLWSNDYKTMWIQGVVVDSVSKVAAAENTISRSKQLAYSCGKKLGLDPIKTKDRFWRTLIANRGCRRSATGRSVQYPAPADMGLRYQASQKEIAVPSSEVGEGIAEEWYLEYFKPFSYSYSDFHEHQQSQFFTTSTGRFGIGQTGVLPGDLTCILFGGKVIFLLRACGQHYLFVGCAYIHGIMDGEQSSLLENASQVREFEVH